MEAQSDNVNSHWQSQLENVCHSHRIQRPIFEMFSDRRGGRTAWSSAVTVHGKTHSSRFWYDGKNINNAKEDAAECAVKYLTGSETSSPPQHYGYCGGH
ncbi:uncharacterized protein B0J16DRAFT_142139 [Fusarium flagelliforme]|uniref:uncharacterized protein n=1 Tax=Fusarium flagelliforme TaxID=2675880 RepID=UPI001E8E9E34|nr:uncharacterized protein B0J16DRAFT_142139 [Fusarium flagelliforme]KAH7185823.1 hypothetical protein B0J16DRAFT_142139 [Fusarium flagelliforme]